MKCKKTVLKGGKTAASRPPIPVSPTNDKVRAVAFKIEDKVYEGSSGASHITLYASLLVNKRVPADTLAIWTRDEKNHGFVTEKGEFIGRSEVFRRMSAAYGQKQQSTNV